MTETIKIDRVNILTRSTPGLMADAQILGAALNKVGIESPTYYPRARNADLLIRRTQLHIKNLFNKKNTATANLFVEQIMPGWLSHAKTNFFIPNQEWCRDETIQLLHRIDIVLCKTHFAYNIFKNRGFKVLYIGFSSKDRYKNEIIKDYDKFLHVAGRSRQKGTTTLSRVWARHPEWPILTIITRNPDMVQGNGAENIRVITEVLSEEALVAKQNEFGVHLCPSEAEGYGHNIAEALGCAAVVVTTDAPPMNELVSSNRGILVPYSGTKPQSLGNNFYVDAEALELAIEKVINLSVEEKRSLGDTGRTWFINNKAEFEYRLPIIFDEMSGF